MSTSYKVIHSHGLTERVESYDEAIALVRAVYGEDAAIGHDGDIGEGGERTLCWADADVASGDDGSRACASIRVSHEVVSAFSSEESWERAREAKHLSVRCARPMLDLDLLQCPHENVSPLGHPWDGVSGWCAGCGAIRHASAEWHVPVRLEELRKAFEELRKAWCGE